MSAAPVGPGQQNPAISPVVDPAHPEDAKLHEELTKLCQDTVNEIAKHQGDKPAIEKLKNDAFATIDSTHFALKPSLSQHRADAKKYITEAAAKNSQAVPGGIGGPTTGPGQKPPTGDVSGPTQGKSQG